MKNYFNSFVAGVGTYFTWLFGAWDKALELLVLFMVLDYLTGLAKGFITKTLSSSVGTRGIAKKAGILIVLIMAVALDRLLSNGNWVFRTTIACFYIGNEGISILENLTQIGLPLPPKFKDVLFQLTNKGDNKNE